MAGAVSGLRMPLSPRGRTVGRPHDKLDPQTIDEKEPQWQP